MSRKKQIINIELLINTVSVQSVSHNDKEMHAYIKEYVRTMGYTCTEDVYGNMYVIKGEGPYIGFVAHTDTVHAIIDDYKVYKHGNTIFAFNGKTGKQYGTGGDDKVGIFCNLQALSDYRNVKLAFFRNEEVGCLGSNNADMRFFDDCNFVVQFDRRGNSDLITSVGGVPLCSKEFIAALKPYADKAGYKETYGLSTDVATLKRKGLAVSTINLSCGYHAPHTDGEIIHISEVNNVYKMIKQFVLEHGSTKFTHKYTPPVVTMQRSINYGDTYYDDETYNSSYYSGFGYNRTGYKNFAQVSKNLKTAFRYAGISALYMDNSECPICKKKEENVCFLPDELEFYCIECNSYITNPGNLFKELIVADTDKKDAEVFVFCWVNACWYKEKDSVWVPTLGTYMLKESVTINDTK